MSTTTEELRAALAAGWRAEVVSDGDVRVYEPDGGAWLIQRNAPGEYAKTMHTLATALAAAPSLLAEVDALKAERDALLAHAEAMARALETFELQGSDKTDALRAYRCAALKDQA